MSRRRRALPHEETVTEIRRLMVNLIDTRCYSDDTDMYYVKAADYSPIERADASNANNRTRAAVLAAQLVEVGEAAAEAVAKGLRMQGRWREFLLPYARAHSGVPVIRAALVLVAARRRDPLARQVIVLLDAVAGPR